MSSVLRLFETLRHLNGSQLAWQGIRRVQGKLENPKLALLWPLPNATQYLYRDFPDVSAPVPHQSAADLIHWRFRFLNQTLDLTHGDQRWSCPQASRLWRYNLHYFDWLWSLSPDSDKEWSFAADAVQDWIHRHPPARGACGWEPYPTSLRVLNWSVLFLGKWRDRTRQDSAFCETFELSLFRQIRWLDQHCEYHILANHLLENAVSLAMATSFISGRHVEVIQKRAKALVLRELTEQILPDGLHYERSAMYHARILWLCQLLAMHSDSEVSEAAQQVLPSMAFAMECMTHDMDSLVLFNDAANHIYSVPKNLASPNASCLERSSENAASVCCWELPVAGYYGAKAKPMADRCDGFVEKAKKASEPVWDSIACNCAPILPSYQPGHTHADTLSFEWHLEGIPFIVDTGTFEYATTPNRAWDRSTAAHNTICLNSKNSSDVWSSFRVGRRAQVNVTEWTPSSEGFKLVASHDGYRPWVHTREFEYRIDFLCITDSLRGGSGGNAAWNLHFGPMAKIKMASLEKAHGMLGEIPFELEWKGLPEGTNLRIGTSRYSPEFGVAIERPCIQLTANLSAPIVTTLEIRVLR